MPNPVEEGNYTCLVPSRYVDALCLPPGTSQGPEATLAVDDFKVRLILMEAQQRSMREDNQRLAQHVTILQQENIQLTENNQRLAQNFSILQRDNLHLQGANQRLAQNVSILQQDNLQLKGDNQRLLNNVTVLQQDNLQLKRDSQRLVQDMSLLQQDNQELKADIQRLGQNMSSLRQHVLQLELDSHPVTTALQGKWKKRLSLLCLGVDILLSSYITSVHKCHGSFSIKRTVASAFYIIPVDKLGFNSTMFTHVNIPLKKTTTLSGLKHDYSLCPE